MRMSPEAAEQAILKRNRVITQLQQQLQTAIDMATAAQAHNQQLARTFGAILLETVGPDVEVRLTRERIQELEKHPLRYVLEQQQDPETKELTFKVRRRSDEEVAELEAENQTVAEEIAAENQQASDSGLVGLDGAPLQRAGPRIVH